MSTKMDREELYEFIHGYWHPLGIGFDIRESPAAFRIVGPWESVNPGAGERLQRLTKTLRGQGLSAKFFPEDYDSPALIRIAAPAETLVTPIEDQPRRAKKKSKRAPKKRKKRSAVRSPRRKYIGHMGDSSPIEHGGGIIYDAGSGPMILYFQPWDDGDDGVSVYNISVDDPATYLDWVEWGAVARSVGLPKSEIMDLVNSRDVIKRAAAHELAGMYHGFVNLDPYPINTTIDKAERKYGRMVNAGVRASSRSRTRI